jgi:hypothetical protein
MAAKSFIILSQYAYNQFNGLPNFIGLSPNFWSLPIGAPGANVTKLFSFGYEWAKWLQGLSLAGLSIFGSKAHGANPYGAPETGIGSGLACKHNSKLEWDKPGACTIKLITAVIYGFS